MTRTRSFLLFVLFASVLSAQQQQPTGRILQIPPARGVYYEGPAGWVNLPASMLVPFHHSGARELLGFGTSKATVEVDGAGAALSIPDRKPTFYMRGYRTGTKLYLVRLTEKQDYRELKLSYRYKMSDSGRFQKEALNALHMAPLTEDVVTLTPQGELAPGEYAIVSSLAPAYRSMRLAFEFGVYPAP